MVSAFDIPDLPYENQAEAYIACNAYYIEGYIEGPHGRIPRLKTTLNHRDKFGTLKVRLGIGRDSYSLLPGLYAVGNPDQSSALFMTANYKLTIDVLRTCLQDLDAWLVVVDTKGINVWCAAGKGTFGTYEVIKKIKELRLKDLVTHRKIILPQLAAPGVAAYQIIRNTGFKAVFGPVRAADIKDFLANDMKAMEEMRTVTFDITSRLILTPVEVMHHMKLLIFMLAAVLIYNIINMKAFNVAGIVGDSLLGFVPLAAAVLTGCVAVPLLLPYIPFRAFAAKGLMTGLVLDMILILTYSNINMLKGRWLLLMAYCIVIPAVTSLLSLNFTGSTTYTSFSGVKKETKLALPIAKTAIAVGIILAILSMLL